MKRILWRESLPLAFDPVRGAFVAAEMCSLGVETQAAAGWQGQELLACSRAKGEPLGGPAVAGENGQPGALLKSARGIMGSHREHLFRADC